MDEYNKGDNPDSGWSSPEPVETVASTTDTGWEWGADSAADSGWSSPEPVETVASTTDTGWEWGADSAADSGWSSPEPVNETTKYYLLESTFGDSDRWENRVGTEWKDLDFHKEMTEAESFYEKSSSPNTADPLGSPTQESLGWLLGLDSSAEKIDEQAHQYLKDNIGKADYTDAYPEVISNKSESKDETTKS